MSPLLRVFLNRFVLFSSVLVWDGRPKRVGKYSFSNENASVDVVSDLPYSYSHNVVLLSTYQVLVPSLDRITFVLNWSILPLVIPVFALENMYEKN